MTSVVRHVKNTMDGGGGNSPFINSTGNDYQFVNFAVTTTAGIAVGANANVLAWTGTGNIMDITSVFITVIATGECIPLGAVAANTHTLITTSVNNVINVSVPAAGVAIPANSEINISLIIGSYY